MTRPLPQGRCPLSFVLVIVVVLLATGNPPIRASVATNSPPELLLQLQERAFAYFWSEASPDTGLVLDRAPNFSGGSTSTVASVAATGFGLAALAVGVEHGWVSRTAATQRALATLQFVQHQLSEEHGWLFHFVDFRTGGRAWKCEASSVDTALFLAGALLAGEYFGGDVQKLAGELYRRVDFRWMLTDGGARPDEKLMCHGWTPEGGFLKSRWDNYSEHLILNLLALGSPTHAIPPACWNAWGRNPGQYGSYRTLACGPLFTHQFSQAYVDFRGRRDRSGYDYFETSVNATKANRQFCIDQSRSHHGYGSNVWGLSACDRIGGGYEAYGAPPGIVHHDGTVAPWATVASVAFTPELVLPAAQFMQDQFGKRLWGRYGFSSAFNLEQDWFSRQVIGIDLGAALLLIEDYQSGKVWTWFMRIPEVTRAVELAGLRTKS